MTWADPSPDRRRAVRSAFAGLFFRFFIRPTFWRREDTVWMKVLGKVINNREEGAARARQVAMPARSLAFWGQSTLILLLFGSGSVLWDVYFEAYTTINQKRLAAVVHASVRNRCHPDLDRPCLRGDLGQGQYTARHDTGGSAYAAGAGSIIASGSARKSAATEWRH